MNNLISEKKYLDEKGIKQISKNIPKVDDALSDISTNTIQNKIVKQAIDSVDKIHSGTTEYWNSKSNLIGEKSHIYIYTDYTTITENNETKNIPNIKIGDGNAYLIDSPFVTTSIEELLQSHIDDNTKHITTSDREKWNSKISCSIDDIDDETIVFTTG